MIQIWQTSWTESDGKNMEINLDRTNAMLTTTNEKPHTLLVQEMYITVNGTKPETILRMKRLCVIVDQHLT